jgi:pimeloyl-ACP methyl ester carboxylesterase
VLADPDCSAEVLGPLAEQLSVKYRVVGIPFNHYWDAITAAWNAGEPVILIAQGGAGARACLAAVAAPGSFRALVLADYAPPEDSDEYRGVIVPTLVFHGRQSPAETHAQAVRLHERVLNSRLIEPENCGPQPTRSCAPVLAESIDWFLSGLGREYMEFAAGSEPVDPRG